MLNITIMLLVKRVDAKTQIEIWPILSIFEVLAINEEFSYKSQTICNQITLVPFKNIDIYLSYDPNKACMPLLGQFWANWAQNFHGDSGDYYLSISDEKFKL